MRRLPFLPAIAVLSALLMPLLGSVPAASAAPAVPVRVLQANIGNINLAACNDQAVKLCLGPVEDRLVSQLRRLDPEVVLLQEVLPSARCTSTPATSPSRSNPFHLCGGESGRTPTEQIDRLLPPERYDTRCDTRFGWDCIGVARSRGTISTFTTLPGTTIAGCDNGFTVNTAVLSLDGHPLQVTSAHPDSGGSRAACRADKLRALFAALDAELPTVLSGDFNLDPYRGEDESIDVWRSAVGTAGTRFRYRSGIAEADPPPFSSNICGASAQDPTGLVLDGLQPPTPGCASTLDHVATTPDVTGPCDTLGEAPGTSPRLDGGGGFDHRGIACTFSVAAGPAGPAPVVPEVPVALLLPLSALLAGVLTVGFGRRGRGLGRGAAAA